MGRPESSEAAPYKFRYIDQVPSATSSVCSILSWKKCLRSCLPSQTRSLSTATRPKSRTSARYSITSMTASGSCFPAYSGLPAASTTPCRAMIRTSALPLRRTTRFHGPSHVEEFPAMRLATLAFFGNLPVEAWMRSGVASGNSFTVRALDYILADHLGHRTAVLRERYL